MEDSAGTSWRARKEAHVSGLSGTSLAEVSAVATVPVILLLLYRCMARSQSGGSPVLEWLVFIPAMLACQLDVITAPQLLYSGAAMLAGLLTTQLASRRAQHPQQAVQELRDATTLFRASLVIITCIAILAVDFDAFPRRFAKAETFGSGLMDAGVGSFVLASAIPAGVAAASGRTAPLGAAKQFSRIAVLAALGAGRALSTHSLDYQNHVGEYGVHWNFFLSLAALRLANLVLAPAARSAPASGALCAGVLLLHQSLLSLGGLIEWVHADGPRSSLLEANKEGLASLPGYLALHWGGVALGHLLYTTVVAGQPQDQLRQQVQQAGRQQSAKPAGQESAGSKNGASAAENSSSSTGSSVSSGIAAGALVRLAAVDTALWLACLAACHMIQPVSRRACNLAYVTWMLALGLQGVCLFLAAGWLRPGPVPRLLGRINSSMLAVFLAANLLTGGVNLTVDTLAVGRGGACAILLAYMAAVAGCAALMPHGPQRQPA